MKSICFVVATKDRPFDLDRMLQSLAAQTHLPDLAIVVDSSAVPVQGVVEQFGTRLRRARPHLPLVYDRPADAVTRIDDLLRDPALERDVRSLMLRRADAFSPDVFKKGMHQAVEAFRSSTNRQSID